MEDTHFLNLLWIERPQELVLGAVSVLETNFMGEQVMEGYEDPSILVVHRLTDLITSSQGPWTWENVRRKKKKKEKYVLNSSISGFLYA